MFIRSTPSACGCTRRSVGPVRARVTRRIVRRAVDGGSAGHVGGHKFSLHFLLTEWEQVVDAWQLDSWEAYRDVARLGRKTRLPEAQRRVLWSIFERVRAGLQAQGSSVTEAGDVQRAGRRRMAQTGNAGLRLRGRRRGAGHQRRAAAVPRGARRRTAERAVLRRRPRPAHLPAAVLLEGARRRHPRPRRGRCASTTAPRTRSGRRPTGCSGRRSPTWTATRRTAATRSRCSTARPRRSQAFATRGGGSRGRRRLARGSPGGGGVLPHEIGVFVRSAAQLAARAAAAEAAGVPLQGSRRARRDDQRPRRRSARCTSPRAWSSAPWP